MMKKKSVKYSTVHQSGVIEEKRSFLSPQKMKLIHFLSRKTEDYFLSV